MAKAEMTVTVRLQDLDRFRLFLWELRTLVDDMRVGASPFAERLEHMIDRIDLSEEGDRPDAL